jgi:hypothetical protein
MKTVKAIIAIWLLAVLIAWVFGDVSVAGENDRSTCNFLSVGVGARAAGLGGAFTAIADDASAVYWNPAGLESIENRQLQFSHYEWLQDLRLENLYLAFPAGAFTVGAGITYLDYGQVAGYDEFGYTEGELSLYSLSASLSIAARLAGPFSIGVTGKYIEQSLDLAKGSALAGDAGLRADFGKVSFGAAVTNIGSKVRYISYDEDLPAAVRVGLAVHLFGNYAVLATDWHGRLDGMSTVHQGVELGLTRQLLLRGGLEYQDNQIPGLNKLNYDLGVGLVFGGGRFDYTFIPLANTQDTAHVFSIGLAW